MVSSISAVSVISSHSESASIPVSPSAVADDVDETGLDQLLGGDVDRQAAIGEPHPDRPPVSELCQRIAQHDRAEFGDQPARFGQRQELPRRQQTTFRMQPAGQHLEADDVSGSQVDDRLEVRHQLVAFDATTEFGRDLQRARPTPCASRR